jgi:hypothetical protein
MSTGRDRGENRREPFIRYAQTTVWRDSVTGPQRPATAARREGKHSLVLCVRRPQTRILSGCRRTFVNSGSLSEINYHSWEYYFVGDIRASPIRFLRTNERHAFLTKRKVDALSIEICRFEQLIYCAIFNNKFIISFIYTASIIGQYQFFILAESLNKCRNIKSIFY